MAIEKFEDIEAWQAARELTRAIYKTTNRKEFSRDYGLRDQIQRAAVSVMANIAEGFDSQSNQTFQQFLTYAVRSATEVQSHLYVALDQGYINETTFAELYKQTEEVKKTIYGFMRYLRANAKKH
ncbi:MAG: four helix bundle protein [Bacillota bacterium]